MARFFSKKEYQQIADIFQLGTIKSIEYFRQGYQTPKIVMRTSKGKYVIAKHNLSSQRKVVADMKVVPRVALACEIEFLNSLDSLPVPRYIQSKQGNYLEDFHNYAVSAYEFLPGRQPKRMTLGMIRQLGEFMGAFHVLGSGYKKPLRGRRKFYELNRSVMALMLRYVKKQTNPQLKAVVEEVKQGVENNRLPRGFARGPIHVDIKPDNELFVGNALTGIIDFGNMYVGPLLFDIGKTIMWNCVKKGKIDMVLMKSFLDGYETQRKLPKKEQACLKQAILFAIYSHLWVDLYHVPIQYVPESYTLFLVKNFLPIARRLEERV